MQTLRLADPRLVALHVRPQGGLEGGGLREQVVRGDVRHAAVLQEQLGSLRDQLRTCNQVYAQRTPKSSGENTAHVPS